MRIKSALTFFPKDLYNSAVELNKALKIKNQTSHFILVMLHFILLLWMSSPCRFWLGFLPFPCTFNQCFKAVSKGVFRPTTDRRKHTDVFCYGFVRYGITWSVHSTPTCGSYRRIPKCWNDAAEEQKHPWDSNLQTFIPMINYSAMRNFIWIIKSAQSTKVKYIQKYLQAWTLMWPKETAKKPCSCFFFLSSAELIPITNWKDLLRKKTGHWVEAFPGDTKF